MDFFFLLALLLLIPRLLCQGKLCTNTGVSHTLRAQVFKLLDSEGVNSFQDGRNSVQSMPDVLSGRRIMLERNKSPFLESLSLHDVRLSPDSWHGTAQQTNLEYLLMLDIDNLIFSFRTTAGLNASGSPYGGWELPTSELRGHFVGHYLSATAMAWAATHNLSVYKNMNAVVEALAECQTKIGTGYLSAFPTSLFDRFEALATVWAPYYTIHKIMAGLLDQYTFAANNLAFQMLIGMADYFANRVEKVIAEFSIERHWQSLNEETGGMNDVMYRLYQITRNERHLRLAHLFDKPCFLGMLAVKADSISGFHANTHIPVVIGAQMRYETVGDELFKDLSEYFMQIVSSSHAYATGGTSSGEFWSDPSRLGSTLGTETEESCTTYNMLKVARNLFRWTKEMQYADFYERALTNGILSIQRGKEPGVMIYMLPLAAGSSKAKTYHGWGTPYTSFWCCYGTAIESFAKLGDSIYFEVKGQDIPHLYVIQFVSSTASWIAADLTIEQRVHQMTSADPVMTVTFNFSQSFQKIDQRRKAKLSVRVPYWASSEVSKCSFNGIDIGTPTPETFFEITKKWKAGDSLLFNFSAVLRLERIQDDRSDFSSFYAIYYGPYLLAGISDGNYKLGSVNLSAPWSWIFPVMDKNLFSFSQQRQRGKRFLAAGAGGTLSMIDPPLQGSEEAPLATFKLKLPPSLQNTARKLETTDMTSLLIGSEISLELMARPRSLVGYAGIDRNIWSDVSWADPSSMVFTLRRGLSSDPRDVSFEASGIAGCFLCAGKHSEIALKCRGSSGYDAAAASFTVEQARASYHPLNFEAYGSSANFLLFPLASYSDERYTVYFDTSP